MLVPCFVLYFFVSSLFYNHLAEEEISGPGVINFFMLNSTAHEISTAHKKLKYRQMKKFIAPSLSDKLKYRQMKKFIALKIVCEYDQEIPQSQTADNPVASRGRAAQSSRDTRKTK